MARTAVTPTVLGPNAHTADVAGTAADPTNGHVITGVPLEELVLRISHTAAAAHDVTIVAGANPPAEMAGQGSIVEELAIGNVTPDVGWFGPFTSARFVQSDGALYVDLEAGFTGTVTAFRIPRTA